MQNSQTETYQGPPYFVTLQSLRGIAIIIIIIHNVRWVVPPLTFNFFKNGDLLVDFFFILSGFLIFNNDKFWIKNVHEFFNFIISKIYRLYPLHFLFLIVFLGIEFLKYFAETQYGLVANSPAFSRNNLCTFISNIFLLQSFKFSNIVTFNGPSWFVSALFYTYISFGVILLAIKNKKIYFLLSLIIVIISTMILVFVSDTVTPSYKYAFFRGMNGFYLGILTRIVFNYKLTDGKISSVLSGLMLLIILIIMSMSGLGVKKILILPVFMILIWAAANLPYNACISKLLTMSPLVKLGDISFSVLMCHFSILWIYNQILSILIEVPQHERLLYPTHSMGLIFLCLYIITVLVCSSFIYKYIEIPCRQYLVRRQFRSLL